MTIQKRNLLLAAILTCEVLVLVFGISAAFHWSRKTLVNNSVEQVLQDNKLIAEQFARFIDEIGLRSVKRNTVDWNRLQSIVESFKLPNNGFVCVTDANSGHLICHPRIKVKPEMAKMKPGLKVIVGEAGEGTIVKIIQTDGEALGRAELPDGTHLIAAKTLNRLNANVMVHQQLSEIEKTVASQTSPIIWIGVFASVLIVAGTGVGSSFLLQRYESTVESMNKTLESELRTRTRSLVKTRNAIIFGLAKLAESRDTDTGEHLDRICDYTTMIARQMQKTDQRIDDAFVADIGLASALHDIGKVGVPDDVLLKPGRLNSEERTIIEEHPKIGCKTLLHIERRLGADNFLEMATEICIAHHERWDGSGYPLGLSGERIPLAARIVAVADVYDALTSQRPYKEAMSHSKASQIIIEGSGSQFDPAIVAAFASILPEIQSVCQQYGHSVQEPAQPAKVELQAQA